MIKSFICEILHRQVIEEFLPIKCYVGDKSLTDSTCSAKTATEKRLQIDICINYCQEKIYVGRVVHK